MYDSKYTLLDPTYDGYEFLGWYYNNELFDSEGTWNLTNNITLTAKWTEEFNITYILNGGTNNTDNPNIYIIETKTIVLKEPTMVEHIFMGWYTEPELINKIEQIEEGSVGDIVLYAKWISRYIYFGEYPQTLKNENVTITTTEPDSNGYYLGSDGERYAKVVATPYSDGTTYFSNKQQIVKGTTYYFKIEPIKWRILQVNDTEYKLMTDLIIDNPKFSTSNNHFVFSGTEIYPANYNFSDLREWLNSTFLNKAFSADLQTRMKTVYSYIYYGSDNKVVLLNYEDMKNREYGFIDYDSPNKTRAKVATDYARAKGCLNYYWLRSLMPAKEGYVLEYERLYCSSYVYLDGSLYCKTNVAENYVGVAPSITITINN